MRIQFVIFTYILALYALCYTHYKCMVCEIIKREESSFNFVFYNGLLQVKKSSDSKYLTANYFIAYTCEYFQYYYLLLSIFRSKIEPLLLCI